MALPSSGPISLLDIQNEFGGTVPISLNEYFRNGSFVKNIPANQTIATANSIDINQFRNTRLGSPTYTLIRSDSAVTEPGSFTITLNTTDVIIDSTVGYTISGITSSDINGQSLTGSFSIGLAQTDSKTFTVTNDGLAEPTETLTLTLDNELATISVSILDAVSYSASPEYSLIYEGESVTINIYTTGVPFGTTLDWSVLDSDGITQASDFTANSGSISLAQSPGNQYIGQAAFTVTANTEVTSGLKLFSIRISRAGTTVLTVPQIAVQNVVPTYTLVRSNSSVNEGDSFTISFVTNQGGSFGYTISGVSLDDFTSITNDSLSGSVSNGSVLSFTVANDALTEGTETFIISLNNGQASTSVTINDTGVYTGFFGGSVISNDIIPVYSNEIEELNFSTDVMTLGSSALTDARSWQAGLNYTTVRGFFLGGFNTDNFMNTTDELSFSTRAISRIGLTLSDNKSGSIGAPVLYGQKGYVVGGRSDYANTISLAVDNINMNTRTRTVLSATMTYKRVYGGSWSTTDNAYIHSGVDENNSHLQDFVEKINGQTDTTQHLSNTTAGFVELRSPASWNFGSYGWTRANGYHFTFNVTTDTKYTTNTLVGDYSTAIGAVNSANAGYLAGSSSLSETYGKKWKIDIAPTGTFDSYFYSLSKPRAGLTGIQSGYL